MFKRTLAGILVLFLISATGNVVYGINGDDDNTQKIEIVKNQSSTQIIRPENNLVTSDKIILLSGKAKEGSKIIVEVYSKKNFMAVNFDLGLLPKEETNEEYVLVSTDSFEVTELGVFVHLLELSEGKHKIVVHVSEDKETSTTITRYIVVTNVEDAKKEIDNVKKESILDTLKKIITNINQTDSGQ